MAEDLEKYPDRVAESFLDKILLITGGTGFLGKVLVEKLLRCTEPKKIYLLIREKKGKTPNQRINDVFKNPLFDSVRKLKGDQVFEKCIPITGDVGLIDLGISEVDRNKLIDEVQIVYHAAATIRFDDPLKKAVLFNVRGTKLMLELACEMKQLQAYIHISTAYCHLGEKILYEKAYPAAADPHQVIKSVEWMDEKVVEAMTKTLLGSMPNTYAFTKNLGESLCVELIDKLPIVIARPSVVVPIWKEPIPGWSDNINGPTGLLIGAGKGVIRTMYCNQTRYADFVPVDVVANCLLCMNGDVTVFGRDRRYYNVCSSGEYKVTHEEIINMGRKIIAERIPLNGVVWYPGGSLKKSKVLHQICVVLFHYIPALIIDALLICLGYKPILWRVQQRITKGFEVFEYYANRQWDFNNEASLKAREILNPREKSLYKLDGAGVNYMDYFTDCTHAARLYILNEPDDTIPAAKRHLKIMYYVDVICKGLLCFLALYLTYKYIFVPIFGEIL